MAKAVVLLFLLDSLPDFHNVFNTTLHTFEPGLLGVTCDSTIKAPVLQVIGRKLNLTEDSLENLQHLDLRPRYQSHKFQELSPESVNNVGFEENSIQESNEFSIEKSPNYVEHFYLENATKKSENKDIVETMADLKYMTGNASAANFSTEKSLNLVKPNYFLDRSKNEDVLESMVLKSNVSAGFPESAPFLAAIFETVGNVTAQTCGGVVLAPHWVLTAASCVNVLGPFYSNSSNEETDNYYFVVAGAKDPLKDGTVHQVSKIYLNPSTNYNLQLKNWFNSIDTGVSAPSLALLRVEPGVKGEVIGLMEDKAWDGVARIYGWALRQDQTVFEMSAVSSPAKRLSPAECKKIFGIMENNNTMCLSVNETASNYTRMNSGCPVVGLQDGRASLFGVALSDGTQPLSASTLSAHRDWLLQLTSENYSKN